MWRQRLSDWVHRNTEFFARSGEPLDEAAAIVLTGAMMLAVAEVSRAPDAVRARQWPRRAGCPVPAAGASPRRGARRVSPQFRTARPDPGRASPASPARWRAGPWRLRAIPGRSRELLAAFPELQRLLQRQAAGLKLLDQVNELVAGLFVRGAGALALTALRPGRGLVRAAAASAACCHGGQPSGAVTPQGRAAMK